MQAGFNCNMFLGWSLSYFATGRSTKIAGTDVTIVAGLAAKKVNFALDVKGVDLSSNAIVTENSTLKAWKENLKTGVTDMDAKVVSSIKLLT